MDNEVVKLEDPTKDLVIDNDVNIEQSPLTIAVDPQESPNDDLTYDSQETTEPDLHVSIPIHISFLPTTPNKPYGVPLVSQSQNDLDEDDILITCG